MFKGSQKGINVHAINYIKHLRRNVQPSSRCHLINISGLHKFILLKFIFYTLQIELFLLYNLFRNDEKNKTFTLHIQLQSKIIIIYYKIFVHNVM